MRGVRAFARGTAGQFRRIDAGRIGILESIALGAPRDEVLTAIARLAEDVVPGSVAGVAMLDRVHRRFDGAVFPGLPSGFAVGIGDSDEEAGSIAESMVRGEAVSIANTAQDARLGAGWRTLYLNHGIRSVRWEPACAADGTPLGGFALAFRDPRPPARAADEALAAGARLAGLALDSDRRMQQQSLVISELSHRTNNLLSLIGAIAQVTFKGSPEATALRETFEGRMRSLTRAHYLLLNRNWSGTDLGDLLGEILAPYRKGRRVTISGQPLLLAPRAALAFALAVHELATNAAKHGALSAEGGKVRIDWATERSKPGEKRFRFCWIERDGPPVLPPLRRGLGSQVLERGLAQQVDGTVALEFAREGLRCLIDAPCATILADAAANPSRYER